MLGVDHKLKHKEERALKHTAMETARRKMTYEEIEQHFGTHELSTSKTDYSASSSEDIISGDDSESSPTIVQQISIARAAAKVPTK